MSLGSFVQGAFQGYQFGENVKDRKTQRERDKERHEWDRENQEWTGEARQRTREDWEYTDVLRDRQTTQYNRSEKKSAKKESNQDEIDRIREEGFEQWQDGQAPVPENTPQGTVSVPVAPKDGNSGQAAPNTPAAPQFPGVDVPDIRSPMAGTQPFRYGPSIERLEDREIRIPLSQGGGDSTLAGGPGADVLNGGSQPDGARPERGGQVSPVQPPRPNAIDPNYRSPLLPGQESRPDAPRNPDRLVSPDTIAAENANLDLRDQVPLTHGGGAKAINPAPGLPTDPAAPAGPEGGNPIAQAKRNYRSVIGDDPKNQPINVPQDTAEQTGTLDAPQAPGRSTETAVRDVDPEASAFMQDIQGMMRNRDISGALGKITTGLSTGKYGAAGSPAARALGGVVDYFTEKPEGAEGKGAERLKTAEATKWFNSKDARALFDANPDLLAAAAADPIGFFDQQTNGAGPAQPAAPPQPRGSAAAAQPPQPPQDGAGSVRTPLSGAGQPAYGGMQASLAAQFQNLGPLSMAIEGGAAPEEVAAKGLGQNPDADSKGQAPQVTQQQRAQGAATFQEYYQREVAPRQVEALYQQGDIEGAERLEAWLKDERSQYLQENYAMAVHAASIGDERGFFDYLGKVYNSFDDGYRFVPEESDLYKNEAGQTVAKVTLESATTGERFTQEYEGGEELIQAALAEMDPAAVYKKLEAQAQAEIAARAEQRDWEVGLMRERIEQGIETEADRRTVASDVMTELMKNPTFATKSPEEQAIEVDKWMRLYDKAAAPADSRPPAPVYIGQ